MKRLKVFGVPWHVGHQYELAKVPWFEQYDLLINPYRTWGESSRPLPANMNWVTSFKRNYYDLVILHVDQQCIYNPDQNERIGKGRLFSELRKTVGNDCPIVVINHMTPFHDKYDTAYVVNYFKKATEGCYMVTNSVEAARQWGWGHPVIHGLDANEWWDLPKEPRCVTVLTPAGMEKAYRRIFLHTVKRYLDEMGVPFVWIGVDKKFSNFDDYREFLGRSLCFFNPTWQSPRPRARTEAMFSGCCVVTTPYQDAHTFIEDGVTGFLTSPLEIKDPRVMDNPRFTADQIKRLVIDEPQLAIKVGQAGKKMAQELFTIESFHKQWGEVLAKIGVI